MDGLEVVNITWKLAKRDERTPQIIQAVATVARSNLYIQRPSNHLRAKKQIYIYIYTYSYRERNSFRTILEGIHLLWDVEMFIATKLQRPRTLAEELDPMSIEKPREDEMSDYAPQRGE